MKKAQKVVNFQLENVKLSQAKYSPMKAYMHHRKTRLSYFYSTQRIFIFKSQMQLDFLKRNMHHDIIVKWCLLFIPMIWRLIFSPTERIKTRFYLRLGTETFHYKKIPQDARIRKRRTESEQTMTL